MLSFKRTIAFLLCLALVLGLCACSEIDNDYGVNSEIVATEESQAEIVKNYDENTKIMSLDRVMPKYVDISLFDEENYSDIYLGKDFKIDAEFLGQNLPVPARLDEILDLGWEFASGNEYNANSLVFSFETIDIVLKNKDGVKIKTQFYNSSRSSVKLSECYLVKYHINNNFYKNIKNYNEFKINEVTNAMAITDIINILGTPSHFYAVSEESYYLDYFISKDDRRNGITIYVNPIDDCITAIEFSYYK